METRTTFSKSQEQHETPLFLFVVAVACMTMFTAAAQGDIQDSTPQIPSIENIKKKRGFDDDSKAPTTDDDDKFDLG